MPHRHAARRAAGVPPSRSIALAALLLAAPWNAPFARAGWAPDGNPVASAPGAQTDPLLLPGKAGAGIVCWRDARQGGNRTIDLRGVVAFESFWSPSYPMPLTSAMNGIGDPSPPSAIPDSAGGAIVVWSDDRNGGGNEDVFVQNIGYWGQVSPSYLFDGVAVCTALGAQIEPCVADDYDGGFFVAWTDARHDTLSGTDVYVQHFTKYGAVRTGWPDQGLPICTAPGDQREPVLVPDHSGGVIVVWRDFRAGEDADLYALRVDGGGAVPPGWNLNGNVVCDAPGDQDRQTAIEDGAGGAFVVWRDARAAVAVGGGDVYVVRVTGDGSTAYGWEAGGNLLTTPGGAVGSPTLCGTDATSIVVAWAENPGKGPAEFRAQRIEQAPDVLYRWLPGGVEIGPAADPDHPPALLADGAGGAFVAWNDPTGNGIDVRAQRLGQDGSPAHFWPPGGVELTRASGSQWLPERTRGGAPNTAIVSDGLGGAIVVWMDERGGPDSDVYAQRVTANALVAPQDPPCSFECSPRYVKRVFPNPTRGPFAVEAWVPSEGSIARFDVFDVHGRRVRRIEKGHLPAPGYLAIDVDLSGLPTGVYFVRFAFVGWPDRSSLGTRRIVLIR